MADEPDDPGRGADAPRRTPRPCPICKSMSVARYHPFCSRRCADIDLHRWLSGRYAIPAVEPPDGFEGGAGPAGDDDDET